MTTGLVILLIVVAFIVSGLMALYRNAKQPLPKNLPPPLKDEDEDS